MIKIQKCIVLLGSLIALANPQHVYTMNLANENRVPPMYRPSRRGHQGNLLPLKNLNLGDPQEKALTLILPVSLSCNGSEADLTSPSSFSSGSLTTNIKNSYVLPIGIFLLKLSPFAARNQLQEERSFGINGRDIRERRTSLQGFTPPSLKHKSSASLQFSDQSSAMSVSDCEMDEDMT